MKTRTKGIIAAVGFIFSIGIYYFLIQGIDWFWSDFCEQSYCMKTLSLAEFLAIEAALIGVYFVISSLDDWKHQDKYQTAKSNLVKLHEINSTLLVFKKKLSNFDECYVEYFPNSLSDNDIKETNSFKKYKAIKSLLKIQEKLEECDHDINKKSVNLFQNNFESCINLAKTYIQEIEIEISNLNNKKRVEINNKITEQQEKKRKEEELIENMSEGYAKDLLKIAHGANKYSFSLNPTSNNDTDKLDINCKDIKEIMESKNNEYMKFSSLLEEIQTNINGKVG
ncbi:hypothetical protein [Acinetobacter seifertii]|uniref:hypothetical protein n=1 Tax=Acinetobacter seifertii TaxID=1530123 RepID=UPI00386285E9